MFKVLTKADFILLILLVAIGLALAVLATKEFADEYQWRFRLSESPSWLVRHVYLVVMIAYIILFGVFSGDQFIYFQF